MSQRRIAVILFNLGGPDKPEAVRPFLFNLFNDPAILRVPALLRTPLAWLISTLRAPKAAKIYEHLGGGSPLLPNTKAQAEALEVALNSTAEANTTYKVFICMRYWHPLAPEVANDVLAFAPSDMIYAPLYPQFSSTTTQSSIDDFSAAAGANGLRAQVRIHTLCCYPTEAGFVRAMAAIIHPALEQAAQHGEPRLLFSAHGLPEKIIKQGDPYQWQCEQTTKAIVDALGWGGLDWVNCYQSRVGPMKWIGPSTEAEIERAGHDKRPVVLAPIAFVSEHSETLVELDIEYKELAVEAGVPAYIRTPTVGTHPGFISALAGLVRRTFESPRALCSQSGGRLCPKQFSNCPHKD